MAATNTITMLSSSVINADGQTTWFAVKTATMADLLFEVVSGTGTITGFDVWLDVKASADATIAFEHPFDLTLKSNDAAAAETVTANARDIISAKTTTTAERFLGKIHHLAGAYVRLRWKFAGTSTPALTCNAYLVVK